MMELTDVSCSALRRLNPGFASILAESIPAYDSRTNSTTDTSRLGSAASDDDIITPMNQSRIAEKGSSSSGSGPGPAALPSDNLKFRGVNVAPTTPTASYLPAGVQSRVRRGRTERWNIPFIWRNDMPRGVFAAMASLLHYALM